MSMLAVGQKGATIGKANTAMETKGANSLHLGSL